MSEQTQDQVQALTPHPALRKLDRFVGSWTMEGGLVGGADKTIHGTASYRWLPGGFFMEQHVTLDFAGFGQIDTLELIGYDPDTDTFPSTVYSNKSPQPLPYTWEIDGDDVTISVRHGPLDATFTGRWSADGEHFGGGWRPNPGADETINIAYDVAGGRAEPADG